MRNAVLGCLAIMIATLTARADESEGLRPPTIDLQPDIPTMDLDNQAPTMDDPLFDEDDPDHVMPDPFRACATSQEELDRVRARALEFLFERHPELNQECERLKSGITFAIQDQVCFVESGMIRDEACRVQAKNSYVITISVQDLEPLEVYWRPEDRYVPQYQGDLEEFSNLPTE